MSDDRQADAEVREGRRIAKVMARSGLCSRREAETWIAAGRVTVNGRALESPAYNVSPADDVRVDGRPLATPERTRLFLFHKPRGLVTTARDPEGRPTIFDALPPGLPRLVAVGRLDINTEGLLLLTNDGGLARVLELPATGWLRRYRVRAHGQIDQAQLSELSEGLTLEGVRYAGIEARLDREQGSNVWITMGLREGKNREIKKVMEHLGLTVNRLIRVSFGPFELGDLGEGEVAEVRTRVLRDQLGAKLAKAAGADFDAPLVERAPPAAEPRRESGRPREDGGRAAERKGGQGKESRGSRRDRDAPTSRPPSPSTPPRRRKHISALRAEITADGAGPRKRVERTATHDRRGRPIAVERHMLAGEAPTSSAERKNRGGVSGNLRGAGPSRKPRKPPPSNRTRSRERHDWPARPERRQQPAFGPRPGRPKEGEGAGRSHGFNRADERRPGGGQRSGEERRRSDKQSASAGRPQERGSSGRGAVPRRKGHGSAGPSSPARHGGGGPASGRPTRRGPGGGRRPPKKR